MSTPQQLKALVGFYRAFVRDAFDRTGGRGFPRSLAAPAPVDPDLLTTLLVLGDALSHFIPVERHRILDEVLAKQQEDGSFSGESGGPSRAFVTAAAVRCFGAMTIAGAGTPAIELAQQRAGRWLLALVKKHAPTQSVPHNELALVAAAVAALSNHPAFPAAGASADTLARALTGRLDQLLVTRTRLWALHGLLAMFHQCGNREWLTTVEVNFAAFVRQLTTDGAVPGHLDDGRPGDSVTQALFTILATALGESPHAAAAVQHALGQMNSDGSHKPVASTGLELEPDFAHVSDVYAAALVHEAIRSFAGASAAGRRQIPLWMSSTGAAPRRSSRLVTFMTHEPPDHACPRLRADAPLTALAARGDWDYAVGSQVVRGYVTLSRDLAAAADVVLFQRFFPAWLVGRGAMPLLERGPAALVYDIDDWIFELPSHLDAAREVREALPALERAVQMVDLVTTTTEPLAERLRGLGARDVVVVPNAVSLDEFSIRDVREAMPPRPLRIVFAGTPSHLGDLRMIAPVIRDLLHRHAEKIELHLWGCVPPELESVPGVVTRPDYVWDYRQYARELTEARFDVALAPLEATSFNRCKSSIKWLEYSAAGIPGVYADLDPYRKVVRDGVDGLLAGSLEAWSLAIQRMIDSVELRTSVRDAAHAAVRARGTLGDIVPVCEAALLRAIENRRRRPAASQPRNPIIVPTEELLRAA